MKRMFSFLSIFVLGLCVRHVQAAMSYDLTYAGASETINGGFFQQVDPQSTGTGVIQSFLRIQQTGNEAGYNTDSADYQFQEKGGGFTHSLLLSDVPIVNLNGTNYRQFLLDINQTSSNPLLSLNDLKIYLAGVGNYDVNTAPTGGLDKLDSIGAIWSLDGVEDSTIELNFNLNPGSGAGDMLAYIPDAVFVGAGPYVYLYSKFGNPNASNDGFEEWAVLQSAPVPVPAAAGLCAIGLGLIGWIKRRVA